MQPLQLRRDFGSGFSLHPKEEAMIRANAELSVSRQHKIDGVPFNPAKVGLPNQPLPPSIAALAFHSPDFRPSRAPTRFPPHSPLPSPLPFPISHHLR